MDEHDELATYNGELGNIFVDLNVYYIENGTD